MSSHFPNDITRAFSKEKKGKQESGRQVSWISAVIRIEVYFLVVLYAQISLDTLLFVTSTQLKNMYYMYYSQRREEKEL